MVRKHLVIASLVAVAAISLGVAAFERSGSRGGAVQAQASSLAPDFNLLGYNGGPPVSLSQYRGKVVMIFFWFPS